MTLNHADRTQGHLLRLAFLFLIVYALVLTLAPAARLRTWDVAFIWHHWLGLAIWTGAFGIANRLTNRYLPDRDPYLLPIAGMLTGWGLLTIWRVASDFGLRQTAWLAIGIGILSAGLRLPSLRYLRDYKYIWLTSGLLLTGLTLLFGTNPSGQGPRLWLGCCGFYFQPSEPLKLLLIVYLAAYLADRQFLIPRLLPLLAPTLAMTSLTILLLLVQRDLGTASIFLILYSSVIYFATGKLRVLVISAMILVLAAGTGFFLFDVVRLRIEAWINPWLDPSGRSYQIVQSLMAVAAGGVFGRGPGLGNPTVVPVHHSDFIFASIAEETGLMGALGLIILVALFTARGLGAALNAPDSFRRYLAVGLTTYITAQMTLIAGGNLRLLPLTGVTLPFVSYGGSSLITSFLALFMLLVISQRRQSEPAPLTSREPAHLIGGALYLGLMGVALVTGWWAVYRGPSLVTRTDNPRRVIADRFVPRGALLDREATPLNLTVGETGAYQRVYQVPDLTPVLGYLHPVYGQAGLEAALDDYLRGLTGQSPMTIWWNHLVYGQPPPGLDVRLSLDMGLQRIADSKLASRTGALVLLNAQSGEILVMASHPTFDPNELDEIWPELIVDPDAPLLNRAVLGRYHPGSALGPIVLATSLDGKPLPDLPAETTFNLADRPLDCAVVPAARTWEASLKAGCPGPLAEIGRQAGAERIQNMFRDIGVYEQPLLRLETGPSQGFHSDSDPASLALGGETLRLSPLQIALAAAALSADGIIPAPRLAMANAIPGEDWVLLPPLSEPKQVLPATAVRQATQLLAIEDLPIWEIVATTPTGTKNGLTWYVAGTTEDWQGIPLALALLLEETDPAQARLIGQNILMSAFNP